jgi:hypothetical protein
MSNPFFDNIKHSYSAILKAHDVISGEVGHVDYFGKNELDCWSNNGLCLRLNYIELASGIIFFETTGEELLFDNEPSDASVVLSGSLNEYNKMVDDIFYKQYRIAIDYSKGINYIRKRYLTDENTLGVFCDYEIQKSAKGEWSLNYQLTLSTAFSDPQKENSRINYYLSVFLIAQPKNTPDAELDFQALFVIEEDCSGMEYNPLKDEPFPNDKRNTYVLRYDEAGRFIGGRHLFYNEKKQIEIMHSIDVMNYSMNYFGFNATNSKIDLIATMGNIMKCVDEKAIVDLKECFVATSFLKENLL